MFNDYIIKICLASWEILLESSGFILFGFFIAGLLKTFVPENLVAKHLGKRKISNILKASAFGIPIPLCSCGVIPAAAGLREQGASKGATASFLISTPETGVDSIAISWALLDPVMTILRPLSAFLTAITTGILVNFFDHDNKEKIKPSLIPIEPSSCGCGCSPATNKENQSLWQKLAGGMKFAFGDLFEDIGKWFIAGVVIAGIITTFLSPALIETYFGTGIFSMLAVLLIATPLYVCATASTPIAAALALKGLSPGAALVFLLAGPATNAASLTVISKILGKKTAGIYLASIIICSLLLGISTNYIYYYLGLDVMSWVQEAGNQNHGILPLIFTIILILLLTISIIKSFTKKHA